MGDPGVPGADQVLAVDLAVSGAEDWAIAAPVTNAAAAAVVNSG